MIYVEFTTLDDNAKQPANAYGNDAGWDLFVLKDVTVKAGKGADVRSGIAVAIPDGYYGRIVGRSSAFRKRGVMVMEGIIDAGFRGELFSYVYVPPFVKHGPQAVTLKAGESVAQLIIQKAESVQWVYMSILPSSERGERGFGSSGN